MSKIKELKIDSTLWALLTKLANLLDFIPSKLSVHIKNVTNGNIKDHYVEYDEEGFYLVIDNLKGYFDFENDTGCLNMLFVNNKQQEKYYKIFRKIFKVTSASDNSELKSAAKIRLFPIDDLPVGYVFKIHSMTMVVRSVVENDNKFHPQISLNHCLYEEQNVRIRQD